MKTSLSSITNLNISPRGRKLPVSIYEFVATVLSEYALSNLKVDSNDSAFHSISSYFVGGEILAKDLIQKLLIIPEIASIFDCFPSMGNGKEYDYAVWSQFLSDTTWEYDGKSSVFVFKEHTYAMENKVLSVRQNEEPAEQDSVQSGKREKMVVCPKCCSIVSNYAGVCPRCKAILSSNRTTNLNTANSQKASSASWLDEYKKNTLKADSGTSKYHSLQETEMSGDWRREELRRSDLRKDEAKIEKVYTSPTSNFYYDYDETDCGPDSLSDSYWDYHGCD